MGSWQRGHGAGHPTEPLGYGGVPATAAIENWHEARLWLAQILFPPFFSLPSSLSPPSHFFFFFLYRVLPYTHNGYHRSSLALRTQYSAYLISSRPQHSASCLTLPYHPAPLSLLMLCSNRIKILQSDLLSPASGLSHVLFPLPGTVFGYLLLVSRSQL